jgi:hypothetical protein
MCCISQITIHFSQSTKNSNVNSTINQSINQSIKILNVFNRKGKGKESHEK